MADNLKVTSTDPTGATVATDNVGNAHYQYVKIAVGSDNTATPCDDANPIPIVYTSSSGAAYLPVAGSTNGVDPVQVQITGGASFDFANMTISGGTVSIGNNVTADIATIAAGLTIGVATIGANTVTVDGYVGLSAGTNNIGDVDVLTVAIPTGITCGAVLATTTGMTLTNHTFESGIRITNAGTVSTAYIGPLGAGLTTGYPLSPLDTVFLEMSDGSSLRVMTASGTSDIRFIGS
jgi:hypothetical protein